MYHFDNDRGDGCQKGLQTPLRTRVKFLNGDMVNLLLEIKQKHLLMGNQPEEIFLGPDLGSKGKKRPGKPVRCIRRAFKTALERAGIKDFHFHDLRHTSASHLIMRGASMKAVQEHLNHSSPNMTNRYAHISEKFQKEQVQLLNGLCDLESSKKLVRSEELNKNEQDQTVQTIS